MRKSTIFALGALMAITVFLFASPAAAWTFSGIADWVMDNALNVAIGAIFTIIGGFWGGTAWGKALIKAKLPIMELKDVAAKLHEVRRPSSPGGKSMTKAEKDEVLAEIEELIQSIVTVFGKKES